MVGSRIVRPPFVCQLGWLCHAVCIVIRWDSTALIGCGLYWELLYSIAGEEHRKSTPRSIPKTTEQLATQGLGIVQGIELLSSMLIGRLQQVPGWNLLVACCLAHCSSFWHWQSRLRHQDAQLRGSVAFTCARWRQQVLPPPSTSEWLYKYASTGCCTSMGSSSSPWLTWYPP